MARPLRIQFEGALYHLMSRGDRREAIFLDESDRGEFLQTLEQACLKTGWQVHAYCLMSNHFHLVVEMSQANLAVGMKWLLDTYTQRFNRRHQRWGHLLRSWSELADVLKFVSLLILSYYPSSSDILALNEKKSNQSMETEVVTSFHLEVGS